MKSAKISDLKNNLSRFLAYVKRGGTVRVFDRDVPIADLTPCKVTAADDGGEAALAALERDGLIRRAERELPETFVKRRLPKASASVLAALLEERREDR